MGPIDKDMAEEPFVNHDSTPEEDDTGIWQTPVTAPIPKEDREDIEGDDEPVPGGIRHGWEDEHVCN